MTIASVLTDVTVTVAAVDELELATDDWEAQRADRESTTSREVKAMFGALEQKESYEKTNTHRMSVHPSLAHAKSDVGSATKCCRPQRIETAHACDAELQFRRPCPKKPTPPFWPPRCPCGFAGFHLGPDVSSAPGIPADQ
jgi:hypothetical protein